MSRAALLLALAGALGTVPLSAKADAVEFTAEVDQSEITLDDSVSLKLNLQSETSISMSNPQFHAPDFDTVNEYNSVFVKSFYDNGRIGTRQSRQITKVLKPSKTGQLRISRIEVKADGKTYTAPDLVVTVLPSGAGTPPPRGYGGSGVGLRGAGKRVNRAPVIVRAEVDKSTLFKGEQLIVSYYLYTRVRMFDIMVDKYPALNGFLREDLEMPISGTRLQTERTMLDGVPYERSLLVRYAAYPLQEGKLKVDPMHLKYKYYPRQGGATGDEDDPFTQFFQALAPRAGVDRSEPITVDVQSLPEQGRPQSFTGGVGDFNVTSAVDKYDVRANEAVTLTVKIEGRGNVAAIAEPKAKWPNEVELYDSKGRAKTGKGGVGEKVFEFLLIPRTQGQLALPALEFSFFDPIKKTYVTKTTEPITLQVLAPAPGSESATATRARGAKTDAPQAQEEVRYLKPPGRVESDDIVRGQPVWRWLYWLSGGTLLLFFGLVGFDLIRKGRQNALTKRESRSKAHTRSWEKLRSNANAAVQGEAALPWVEVTRSYDLLEEAIFDALDGAFSIGVRSKPRAELREILVSEKGMPDVLWDRISRVLEFSELVRYASSAGAISEATARQELGRWVDEAESVVRVLTQKSR